MYIVLSTFISYLDLCILDCDQVLENTDLNSKGLRLTEAVAQWCSIKQDVIKNF